MSLTAAEATAATAPEKVDACRISHWVDMIDNRILEAAKDGRNSVTISVPPLSQERIAIRDHYEKQKFGIQYDGDHGKYYRITWARPPLNVKQEQK